MISINTMYSQNLRHCLKNDFLPTENRKLKQKVEGAIKFALVLGVCALVCAGFVVGILVNLSIANDSREFDCGDRRARIFYDSCNATISNN